MARIKLGPVVTDIAGSIGGTTIQRSKFGYTIRSKPLPLYSQTSAQYTIRRLIAFLQYSWQILTDAQRLQWNRFLNFSGQTIVRDRSILLSGQTLFIKYNLWRLMYDQSILSPIVYAPMPDFKPLDIIFIDVGEPLAISFDAIIDSTKYFFVFKVSSPRHENRAYNPSGLRFMKVTFGNAIDFDINDVYIAAFGALPIHGNFVHYSIQYFSITAPVFSGVFTGKLEVVSLL